MNNFCLHVVAVVVVSLVCRGRVGYCQEEQKWMSERTDNNTIIEYSYPELAKLLKGAALTFHGGLLDLNRINSTVAKELEEDYFSEEGLNEGLERTVRLAVVNNKIALQHKLEVTDLDLEQLASEENVRSLDDVEDLEREISDNEQKFSKFSDEHGQRTKRSVMKAAERYKWPNTTIAVVIHEKYTSAQKEKLKDGMKHWENHTCLRFNVVKSHIGPHIRFAIGSGCGSPTGMQNRPTGQQISITSRCMSTGTIAHEMGHSLGLYHEQDRPDRDKYITVVEDKIASGRLANYQKRTWDRVKTMGIPYDYTSLLHYREYQFSKDGNKTIITVDDDMHETVGNKRRLSFFDAKTINYQYCTETCKEGLDWDKCQNGGYRDPNNCTQCRCPDGLSGQFCTEIMDGVKGDCGAKIRNATDEWTELISPDFYGKGSEPFSSCNWLIQTDPGRRILLKLVDLKLDCWRKMACDEDYIAIRYKSDLALPGPRFCCDKPNHSFVSEGTRMLLIYRIEQPYANHGIRIQYKAENCGGCRDKSNSSQPPCLETLEKNCDEYYTDTCTDSTKQCNITRKNICLETVKKCCKGYILDGKECRPGKWSNWTTSATKCSVTCGKGTMIVTRSRTCTDGPGNCTGNSREELKKDCEIKPCPVDGVWTKWTPISTGNCSVTCGGGTMEIILERKCTAPKFGGKDCQGERRKSEVKQCNTKQCPVDGVWTKWTPISTGNCSVTCGGGTMKIILERKCTAPKFGGKDCQGERRKSEVKQCNTKQCPVDGVWTEWTVISTSACSVTCGNGTKKVVMERTCTGRAAGGKDCQGDRRKISIVRCSLSSCPVDGKWSEWSVTSTGTCSASCGGGILKTVLERKCIGPKFGGKNCEGENKRTITNQCNSHPCPVDGVWSEWKVISISPCSLTCGGGIITRVLERTCKGQAFGGKPCDGEYNKRETDRCNTFPCRVDGVWTSWTVTSSTACSVTCGDGIIKTVFKRTCIGRKNGGKDCEGEASKTETKICIAASCAVDGVWSEWRTVDSGICSVTCGGGNRKRIRDRTCIGPKFGGKDCQGEKRKTEFLKCNIQPCPRNGGWSAWEANIGPCSVTCGQGTKKITYTRKCDNPPPANGGQLCRGPDMSTADQNCKKTECPVDGQWGPWTKSSVCSVTCGRGTKYIIRKRVCENPAPQYGGKVCDGGLLQTENVTDVCYRGSCVVDGNWGPWKVYYTNCSAICGLGKRLKIRQRQCDRPRPENGGLVCPGGLLQRYTHSEYCHIRVCNGDKKFTSNVPCLKISYVFNLLVLLMNLMLLHWL